MIPPHIPINAGGLRYGDSKAAAVFRMPDIQPLAGMFRESDRSLICPDLEGGKFSSIVYVAFMDERGDIWNAMDFKNSSEILSRVDRIVSKGSPYESRASGTSTKIFKPATVELSEIAVNDLSKSGIAYFAVCDTHKHSLYLGSRCHGYFYLSKFHLAGHNYFPLSQV
jgi:hypothetical protein